MRGKGRGDRQRHGLGALAAPLDLDEAVLDAAKAFEHAAIELLAFLGEHRAARLAVEQANAEMLLELSEHPAYRRLRDVEFGGSRREAAIARCCVKDEQGVT
ncbi:hypothetical protein ABIF96_007440 [Bradyrhizobium ottawaense]